jgi:hypothetical protein
MVQRRLLHALWHRRRGRGRSGCVGCGGLRRRAAAGPPCRLRRAGGRRQLLACLGQALLEHQRGLGEAVLRRWQRPRHQGVDAASEGRRGQAPTSSKVRQCGARRRPARRGLRHRRDMGARLRRREARAHRGERHRLANVVARLTRRGRAPWRNARFGHLRRVRHGAPQCSVWVIVPVSCLTATA